MLKKLLIIIFGVIVPLVMILAVFVGYSYIFDNNVNLESDEVFIIYVDENETPIDIFSKLVESELLKNEGSFKMVAQQKKWFTAKTGRYSVKSGMSNNDLVNMFRAGLQDPVQLTLNQIESVAEFAGSVGQQMMVDSFEIFQLFTDREFLTSNNLNYATIRSIILPNTYEMYWNATGLSIRTRMMQEFANYWNDERLESAKRQNLSPLEVSILASIVEKETAKFDEMPVVAGLYINRLKKGMKLQSDPTVIYAKRLKEGMDIEVKRVLYADLEIDSPYNTYKYAGLPPAPITIPSLQAINAVLNPQTHKYIFMCADPDRPGYHSFAANSKQHGINKQKYVKWLNEQGIRR